MFTGITAGLSAILGLISAFAPKVADYFTAAQTHKQQIELLTLQASISREAAAAERDGKIKLADAERMIAESNAFREVTTAAIEAQKPIGIAWIDGMNAALRSSVTIIVMLPFLLACFGLPAAVKFTDTAMYAMSFEGVLGFVFGFYSKSVVRRA